MNLAYHVYALQSAAPLGALSQGRVRHGALLRVSAEGGEVGYADLHPWAELGDLPLIKQIGLLRQGETTELTQASLAFAALDAQARAMGRSLWDGLAVPASHFLLPGITKNDQAILEKALTEGFTHFKIKLGKNLDAEKQNLLETASFLKDVSVAGGGPPRLRLDYNETLTSVQFAGCFETLEPLQPFLDFVEDPFPFESSGWSQISKRMQIKLAVDRAASACDDNAFNGVVVHKPARSGLFLPPSRMAERRLVVTSYLDHPVGQLCAAWVAAQTTAARHGETDGLVSHRVYARTRFSDRLGWSGPYLKLPEGHGFGFDDELAEIDWKPLT